ncbi:MAG: hypothetical protein EBV03_13880, partial [Proteobacteria bacterium]|nr:hypothetical protein [Pseudomonadota bacterium]
ENNLICDFVPSYYGNLPLSTAIYYGKLNVVEWLLEQNLEIDISANDEEAFRIACIKGYYNIVLYLLRCKPEINIYAKNREIIEKCLGNKNYYQNTKIQNLLNDIIATKV